MTAAAVTSRATEERHNSAPGIHAVSPREALARLLAGHLSSLDCLDAALPDLERAAARAAHSLRNGHKLAYAGAGSSGLMALADCLELAGTYGIAPAQTPMLFAGGDAALHHMTGAVEDDPALALADLEAAGLGPGDTVICVSASGRTPYTLAIAQGAQARGAQVIGLSNVAGSALLSHADIAIALETGPEVIAGSTRMAAGSAQKIALNLLSTLTGIGLGHVHDGLMVNLTADNGKLRARATAIVSAISGAAPERCEDALSAAQGAVKPAILIAAGADPARAHALLEQTQGHLAPALEALHR